VRQYKNKKRNATGRFTRRIPFFHVFAFISNHNLPVAYDIMGYSINNHDGASPVETQNLASHEQVLRY